MTFDVKSLLYTSSYRPGEIDRVLDPENPTFLEVNPEVGYILRNYVFRDGMDQTLCQYTYERHGGHRKVIHYAEQPCRLNTYGDSFTQCAQVNDGESWQEVLAAHFREPIRNYGVGGYGVYQAYRTALRVEAIPDLSAEYVLLNIWDDDHLRNVDAARWVRVGWMHKDLPRGNSKDAYPVHGFPWAHVRYDLDKKQFVEMPGMCKSPADLRKLADSKGFYEAFKDDPVAHLFVLREGGTAPVEVNEALAKEFGVKVNLRDPKTRQADAAKLHWAYGIRSTIFIVEKMRAWAANLGKKLFIVLSYNIPAVRDYLTTGERFDQAMVDYLKGGSGPYMDVLAKYAEDYKAYKLPVNDYLDRQFIGRAGAQVFGHYNPYGNFWFAHSLRPHLVDWLNPKPPSYQGK